MQRSVRKMHAYFGHRFFDMSEICRYISDTMPSATDNLKDKIRHRTDRQPHTVWTPSDFLDLGNRDAVDKVLQRLARAGQLRRIDRGLYDKPAINTLTHKPTAPDYRELIQVVSRRDQTRMLLDGMTAANDLGLTDAVPGKVVVLTDARIKPLRVGNMTIQFKPTAPSKLFWAGRPAMRVVQALYWLKDIFPTDKDRIMKRLQAILSDPKTGKAIQNDLRDGLPTLPTWMQRIVRDLLAKVDNTQPAIK